MAAPKKKDEEVKKPRGFLKAFEAKRKEQHDFMVQLVGTEKTIYIGDPAIDWAQGGYQRGGMNLSYGPSKSGKSTKQLKLAAIEQRKAFERTGVKHWVIIYDSEYAHDMDDPATIKRLQTLGLDTDYVAIVSSNEVNELFADIGRLEGDLKATRDAIIANAKKKDADQLSLADLVENTENAILVASIVVDSWGGVQSEQAKEKLEKGNIAGAANAFGGNAKTINPILQTLLRIFAKYGVTGFMVQHCIENMDKNPVTGLPNGPKWILLGGQKLRFLSHAIDFMEGAEGKDSFVDKDGNLVFESGGISVGKKIYFRCEKSRKQVEGRKASTWINFGTGEFIRRGASLFNLAEALGIVYHPVIQELDKKGKPVFEKDGVTPKMKTMPNSWWSVIGDEERRFNGKENMWAALEADKEYFDMLFAKCLSANSGDATGGVKLGAEEGIGGEDSGSEEEMAKLAEEAIA